MEGVQFSRSRSGEKTCSVNGVHLHSTYDPAKEARRFADAVDVAFEPELLVVVEPALSHCAAFLRQRFPSATLVAIRLAGCFGACDRLWDRALHFTEVHRLLNWYGEDKVLAAHFLSWPPSQRAFPQEHRRCWEGIRTLVETSRDILGTREFFGRRWLKNSLSFCAKVKRPHILQAGSSPILLAASGPSLETSLEPIKEHRASFFLIAISSALSPLLAAGILPDLCVSTDGGYWAKRHITACPVPLAVPAEAAIPGPCTEGRIVPLQYGDGPETELLEECGIPALPALRNGTASGTALELALTLTSGPVFACGLDLSPYRGFQHCQPNALEEDAAPHDNRLHPKETRLFPGQLPSKPLEIYGRWFSDQSQRLAPRFRRLAATGYRFKNSLDQIRDIDWEEFEAIVARLKSNQGGSTPPSLQEIRIPGTAERRRRLTSVLEGYRQGRLPESWLATAFPARQALLARGGDRAAIKERLRADSLDLLDELLAYLDALEEGAKDAV